MSDTIDLTRSDNDQDDETVAQLYAAIESAAEERVRDLMVTLASDVPAARQLLLRALVPENGQNMGNENRTGNGVVRRAEVRWETCKNCGEEYDANEERECVYHPAFVDWDEDVHGEMDTKRNRRDYPENFTWTCCKRDGRKDGCREDVHAVGGRKKVRRH
ncbi:hypothetical protein GLOTRDRAFT_43780 [Gloeophyllum trabeum ATCC 11539]|uniref:C2H2-type domain-containing protein n=1 Tax=Gloeophyllum trabeum (strain ATCC 11539 / FP-39264 / Madison 617) TaxID=670483 RepID=S7Q3L3_GLOTA|nr:uncharacterized protein GLOTRDRAFT_43780 [Gloeophyllum trabeum ATCC 11539]EPQ53998.1 hypothetical protein GLOTRDRAFT_43780 [Gloeophyllum trabeum ATCC 11539]